MTSDGEPAAEIELHEADLAATWHEQLVAWLADAVAAGLAEPTAMVLATADSEGRPSARTVLAKLIDPHGVTFFTNLTSRKARELAANRVAAATFPWYALRRQVQLSGSVEPIGDAESDEYWRTRPRGSQLGAWASAQSTVVRDRAALEASLDRVTRRYEGTPDPPRPPHWGGLRLLPDTVEFWQGRSNRMHDRLRFVHHDGAWEIQRLAP